MARNKTWILLGALIALLLGAAPASAGVAIDNAVMLDPYDPVPPIQFSHWYAGYGCESGCGHHCWQSCYRRSSCDDGCYRHNDCDDGCYRHRDCYERCGRCEHDCRNDCNDRGCERQNANLPCLSGNCQETERWEHRYRDGDHVSEEWLDRGSREGDRHSHHHHFNDDDDDDYQDGPQH